MHEIDRARKVWEKAHLDALQALQVWLSTSAEPTASVADKEEALEAYREAMAFCEVAKTVLDAEVVRLHTPVIQ